MCFDQVRIDLHGFFEIATGLSGILPLNLRIATRNEESPCSATRALEGMKILRSQTQCYLGLVLSFSFTRRQMAITSAVSPPRLRLIHRNEFNVTPVS